MANVYLKITDSKGKSHLEWRLAWDSKLFIENVTKQYAKEKDPSVVEVATREDYLLSIKKPT